MTKSSTPAGTSYWWSRYSPIPAFPEYTGPHHVGTVDVEIPVADLQSPGPAPENASDVRTIQFRLFYPTDSTSPDRRISWLPQPQRHYVAGYTKFLGVNHRLADLFSILPRHLYYTTIPAQSDAPLETCSSPDGRWPVVMFSHGLGGSRNSYSYIAGSLASHGLVVVCPEHRDGSAVASLVRQPTDTEQPELPRKPVPYQQISHKVSPQVYEAREAQLRIRCWELGLLHQAILDIDQGASHRNLESSSRSLQFLSGKLNVHRPGSIVWAGHSFGATTTVQLLKSVYYADHSRVADMKHRLYAPEINSSLRKQITSASPAMLLDMWCLPLLAPHSEALFHLPLPSYEAASSKGVLAVESEHFVEWREHFHMKARVLSPNPSAKRVTKDMFDDKAKPNFFYVVKSAHLSQSDFGILFPWLTKKMFKIDKPERPLRLNLRAQLEFLRTNGVTVARTSVEDLADGYHHSAVADSELTAQDGLTRDPAILEHVEKGSVEHWRWIDIVGLGDAEGADGEKKSTTEMVEEGEEVMKGELELGEQVKSRTNPSEAAGAPLRRALSASQSHTWPNRIEQGI